MEAALQRRFVHERAVQLDKPPTTLEELADRVAAAPLVATMSLRGRQTRLPSGCYWAQATDRIRSILNDLQWLTDEDERRPTLERLAKRLAEAEEAWEASYFPDSPPLPVWISLARLKGVVAHHVADQVVTVRGGTGLPRLQEELAARGQCLPLPDFFDKSLHFGKPEGAYTVADAIGWNLPHALESQCGSWRDWILGLKVVLPDGALVKSGSQAVKNVTGYDAHKLFVGARGTLGIIVEATLRTLPLDARPQHESHKLFQLGPGVQERVALRSKPVWTQRTRPTDFSAALEAAGERLLEYDPPSCTLYAEVPYEDELPRFQGDWVLRSQCKEKNLQITDSVEIMLMKRAKAIFDPTNKLNPKELGVI